MVDPTFILKVREADLRDLRWRRAVGGSGAALAAQPEMLTIRFANRSIGGQKPA